MHAEALPPRHRPGEDNLAVPIALAIGVHALIALLFFAAYLWSPRHAIEPAAGSPMVEASLVISSADIRSAERALQDAPQPPEPMPSPVAETAEEETVPSPQPLPEPRPQDSPVPPQQQAQERIPVPDTESQEAASLLAISREKAEKEQEQKRRQEQIDLTERERQQEAERKQRLAQQQAEADREKKLADIRRRREQAAREANMAEQRLRQLQNVQQQRATQTASATASAATTASAPGQNGTSNDLAAQYAAAIQRAVLSQWIRPDSVPRGQRCRITIRQLPGGEVLDAAVDPSCPYDEMGRRSVENAVMRAQPLPYRGFESVFQRTLNFNFEAQDR